MNVVYVLSPLVVDVTEVLLETNTVAGEPGISSGRSQTGGAWPWQHTARAITNSNGICKVTSLFYSIFRKIFYLVTQKAKNYFFYNILLSLRTNKIKYIVSSMRFFIRKCLNKDVIYSIFSEISTDICTRDEKKIISKYILVRNRRKSWNIVNATCKDNKLRNGNCYIISFAKGANCIDSSCIQINWNYQ